MNIKKVGNVILAVKDLDKSIEFYNKILGLPIKNKRENWVDLGQSGALLSLHPASQSSPHSGSSIDNGILISFVIGDVASAVDELKSKNVKIFREIQERDIGKNVIILDPDEYMISLFEPSFSAEKNIQTGGYIGFTPA
ncbi:MAG: VOC family protein [Candidatus Nitrosopelagicus sp.]|jgi:lactoylglutathione lyase|nr:VOC family protein [Candidatus Nitrosopelagicus sp.]NWJ90005.1 VOC family protein [Marine Group I thaumarchaeote]HIA97076.1 methylmalonyl-CoA epimerase [Candidatus Nitrosopelagicus sp.]HIC05572.1 methylmalonyl-CoA epimerase [Candidatus Nitrosopelagicus sp.]|tara:strand:- start:215 stop:631 length:417 start_codon:yes stop_codon:yes gene_type:complete